MNLYEEKIGKASNFFDEIAQVILCLAIVLVIVNIFLRIFFSSPILGTYEYVGFLASIVVGLSLANCAFQNGHPAVEFFAQNLPLRVQKITDNTMRIVAFVFLVLAAWHIGRYANSMVLKGQVSASTGTPEYYFVYIVAFGTFMLCLVIFSKLLENLR